MNALRFGKDFPAGVFLWESFGVGEFQGFRVGELECFRVYEYGYFHETTKSSRLTGPEVLEGPRTLEGKVASSLLSHL